MACSGALICKCIAGASGGAPFLIQCHEQTEAALVRQPLCLKAYRTGISDLFLVLFSRVGLDDRILNLAGYLRIFQEPHREHRAAAGERAESG